MLLPFFYKEDLYTVTGHIVFDENTSKHIIQVLRMQKGQQIQITNGQGLLCTAELIDDNRKKCSANIIHSGNLQHPAANISIAISLIKNSSRFEWFLEKATEIGVREIIPLICERTEKITFRQDRLKSILVSAMLQSQQTWLPVLHAPTKFKALVTTSQQQQKFIAHCINETKRELTELNNRSLNSKIILIGPEGDFTKEEIDLAIQHHFSAVSLGNTRLRTETAGMVAATLLCLA